MIRLRHMKACAAGMLAFLVLVLSPTAAAQATDKPAPAASKPAVKAAPAPSVTVRDDSEAALQRARALGAVGAESPVQQATATFLQREERNFDQLLRRYLDMPPAALANTPAIELNEARTTTTLGLSAVREQRRALIARIEALRGASTQLDALRAQWSQQLQVERDRGAPPALLERIAALLQAVDESLAQPRARAQILLELDARVAALADRYDQATKHLDEARRQTQRQLLRIAEPPLWTLLGGGGGVRPEAVRSEWVRASETVQQFWQNYTDHVVLHLILLVLLLAAMASLSASPAFKALEHDSGSVRVLKRPVSSAIVIAIFLSPFLYPALPSTVGAALRLLSLTPVLRLIPTFVPPAWRALFYWITGLFGLEALFLLLPGGSVMSRLTMLLISAVALWTATLGTREAFADPEFVGWRRSGLVRTALRLVALLLVAAIVGNLLGATRLSLLVNVSIVIPAYVAIGLAAAVFVVEDFLRLLLHAKTAQGMRSVSLHRETILARSARLTRLLAAGLWLWLTLRVLDIGGTLYDAAARLLGASMTLGSFELSLGKVLLFLLAVWVAAMAARFTSFILDHDVLPRMRLARGLPATISTTARYLIVGLGLLIAASMAGIDLTQIALILGALSVGIGFGLQNIVNNFISGIILLFERPIQVGDTVQVGELLGVVRNIGIRASNVRTYGGAEVIVPNAELVSGQVINWTLSDRYRRLELDVGVAYGNRPAEVIAILEAVVASHEGALKTPAPFVRFRGFGDSSLDFRVYAWVDYDEGLTQTSAILSEIYDALAEAGIEIPFPQRDLHLRSVSDEAGRALRGDRG
jgi:potassium efflux system protein